MSGSISFNFSFWTQQTLSIPAPLYSGKIISSYIPFSNAVRSNLDCVENEISSLRFLMLVNLISYLFLDLEKMGKVIFQNCGERLFDRIKFSSWTIGICSAITLLAGRLCSVFLMENVMVTLCHCLQLHSLVLPFLQDKVRTESYRDFICRNPDVFKDKVSMAVRYISLSWYWPRLGWCLNFDYGLLTLWVKGC